MGRKSVKVSECRMGHYWAVLVPVHASAYKVDAVQMSYCCFRVRGTEESIVDSRMNAELIPRKFLGHQKHLIKFNWDDFKVNICAVVFRMIECFYIRIWEWV